MENLGSLCFSALNVLSFGGFKLSSSSFFPMQIQHLAKAEQDRPLPPGGLCFLSTDCITVGISFCLSNPNPVLLVQPQHSANVLERRLALCQREGWLCVWGTSRFQSVINPRGHQKLSFLFLEVSILGSPICSLCTDAPRKRKWPAPSAQLGRALPSSELRFL